MPSLNMVLLSIILSVAHIHIPIPGLIVVCFEPRLLPAVLEFQCPHVEGPTTPDPRYLSYVRADGT